MAKPQLEDGYTRISNEILEHLCKINKSAYQSRVLEYIWRKTYGYNKKNDWISISQIVEGTGLKKSHVSRTKKELLDRNLVTCIGNKIAFQKDWTMWQELPKLVTNKKSYQSRPGVTNPGQELPIQARSYLYRDIQKKLYKRNYTKENIQKKGVFIKNLTEKDLQDISLKYNVPLSFVISKLDDMKNWIEAKGKRYKNYKAALSAWVKKDAINILEKKKSTVNKFKVTKI